MSGISPTQRTLAYLRQQGYQCGIVEKFNPFSGQHGIRQDLFGFMDILAITPTGICGIQSCGQSFSAHDRKILENPLSFEWIKAGGNIELWGWRKLKKKRGGKAMIWTPRIKVYKHEDFE